MSYRVKLLCQLTRQMVFWVTFSVPVSESVTMPLSSSAPDLPGQRVNEDNEDTSQCYAPVN